MGIIRLQFILKFRIDFENNIGAMELATTPKLRLPHNYITFTNIFWTRQLPSRKWIQKFQRAGVQKETKQPGPKAEITLSQFCGQSKAKSHRILNLRLPPLRQTEEWDPKNGDITRRRGGSCLSKLPSSPQIT